NNSFYAYVGGQTQAHRHPFEITRRVARDDRVWMTDKRVADLQCGIASNIFCRANPDIFHNKSPDESKWPEVRYGSSHSKVFAKAFRELPLAELDEFVAHAVHDHAILRVGMATSIVEPFGGRDEIHSHVT